MPLLPPVTTATFPWNLAISVLHNAEFSCPGFPATSGFTPPGKN
jgi:hypothetical protein